MYLIDVDTGNILCDAPIFSHVRLISIDEFKKCYSGDGAPPLVDKFTSKEAVVVEVNSDDVDIIWGLNEEYVEVLFNRKSISRILVFEKRGMSIFTLKEGPWGFPWSD